MYQAVIPRMQECLQMAEVTWPLDGAPAAVRSLARPCLQRQVFLQDQSSCQAERDVEHTRLQREDAPQSLVYAASWWNLQKVQQCLKDTSKPIWASLSDERMELYREINNVTFGTYEDLEEPFGVTGPMWGRDYTFWHRGEPLTIIKEVFSSALSQYLGSTACSNDTPTQD